MNLVAPVEIHVAPPPAEHVQTAECWCGPMRALDKPDGVLWIHRLSAPPADEWQPRGRE